MNMEYFDNASEWLHEMIITYGLKIVYAIIILLIGLWVVKLLTKAFSRILDHQKVDPSLSGFLKHMVSILLKVLLFVTVVSMLGVEMTSFIAILGAAGLAVGMALSGTLQNFAGGVVILLFKPFKVGDFIEAQGHTGTVSEIQIFVTILKTLDNKTIIIPNSGLANDSLVNYSTEPQRRVDFSFGIAYGDDFDHAKSVLSKIIEEDSRILKNPAPFIALGEMADSSVNITVRVWTKTSNYWAVFFDLNEKVYKEFPKSNLNIPFPQMDVHLYK